jgi:hypothetical protein
VFNVTDFLGVMEDNQASGSGTDGQSEAFLLCPTFDQAFALCLIHAMSKLKRRDSFHDTTAETIDQETIDMSKYFDKVVLIVNVASR